MLSTLVLLFLYQPLVGFGQDNSATLTEERRDSNLNVESSNLTNVSTICNLQINKSSIENILRLTHIHTTNVVEIEVSITLRNKTRIFPEFKWLWASEIGQTIMSFIAQETVVAFWPASTLTRGIVKAQAVVSEENYGCLPESIGAELVFDVLLKQLSRDEDIHVNNQYKLCRAQEKIKKYNCCRVASGGKLTICAEYSSVVLQYAIRLTFVMTYVILYIGFPLILEYLRSPLRRANDYYKISDNPMALSTIFYTLFLESHGGVISALRRFAFWLTPAVILIFTDDGLYFYVAVITFICLLPLTYFDVFALNEFDGPGNIPIQQDDFCDRSDVVHAYIAIFTFPFNLKYWWKTYKSWLKPEKSGTKFLAILLGVILYIISVGFVCLIVLPFPLLIVYAKITSYNSARIQNGIMKTVSFIVLFFSATFLLTMYTTFFLHSVFLLVIGFYLNGAFYSPFVVPAVAFVVYSWKHWRSFVERKYLVLQTKIYEVCKELWEECEPNGENIDNGEKVDNPQMHKPNVGMILLNHGDGEINKYYTINVISGNIPKELYDIIRKKKSFFPYNTVLFYFFIRMFIVANFFLIISIMMAFAQESGISDAAQIMSILIVSTFPFVVDTIWAEQTFEQKDSNDKKIELNLRKLIVPRAKDGNNITIRIKENTVVESNFFQLVTELRTELRIKGMEGLNG